MNRVDEGEVLVAHMAEMNNITVNALAVTCVSVLMVILVTVIEFIEGAPSPEILSRLGMLHVCVRSSYSFVTYGLRDTEMNSLSKVAN